MRPTKRYLLNVTSTKKRDTMRQWTNTNSSGAPTSVVGAPAYVNGNTGGVFLWCATARDITDSTGEPNTVTNSMQRTATTCFMRGLSERIDIQSSSAVPWKWRRICFALKDPTLFASGTGATINYPGYLDSSHGYLRGWINALVNNDNPALSNLQSVLFQGAQNVDWSDAIMAKVDTRRVDLKFDKTRIIQSGNDTGVFKKYPHWHPMNKNLVYDDDERGESTVSSNFSVTDKRGMGDYVIMDIFNAHASASAADVLRIQSESTLYWHEK